MQRALARQGAAVSGGSPCGPRVFLVEDHPAVCLGLRLLLEQNAIQVCGEARDGEHALKALGEVRGDLVIVDLSLGAEDGLVLLRRLAKQAPGLPLLVYSMHEDASRVAGAFDAGARGYVTKRESAEALVTAVLECLAGRTFASPRAAQSLADAPRARAAAEPLSLQERRVYDLLGQGFSAGEITERLELSRHTVETYFGRIQVKLGLHGMRELRHHAATRRP